MRSVWLGQTCYLKYITDFSKLKQLCQIRVRLVVLVYLQWVGDLFQLPPVCQTPVFSVVRDTYAKLYNSGSLWKDEFQMIQLDEIMRQKDDSKFCSLLCRVRTATHTEDDIAVLKSREIDPGMPDYPKGALHADLILMLMYVTA